MAIRLSVDPEREIRTRITISDPHSATPRRGRGFAAIFSKQNCCSETKEPVHYFCEGEQIAG